MRPILLREQARGWRGSGGGGGTDASFPLSINGRYLQTAQGVPFFIHGDTAWSLENQCTRGQVTLYLDDRKTRGFNAILFEAFEHYFSSQTPAYQNAEGSNPFTTMSPTDFSVSLEVYWGLIDYIVSAARVRGMVCFIACAYYGFNTNEGWQTELAADSSAHLQAYGAFLMNRYGGMGNIVWVLGGDNTAGASLDAQIVIGMRSVRTDQIITGHSARTNDAYSKYSAQTGFNCNSIYTNGSEASYAATAYGRTGPLPFVLIEGYYDNEHSSTPRTCRRQAYATVLSGGCGAFFGNNPIWLFGGAQNTFSDSGGVENIGAAAALASWLGTTATQHQQYVPQLFGAFAWQKLAPKTDTSLITTSLGTGASTLCGALANDGTFAMVFTPDGAGFTIDMTTITHGSVRGRWYDPTTGTYTNASGTPFSNTGTHAFTTPGNNAGGDPDWILVLD